MSKKKAKEKNHKRELLKKSKYPTNENSIKT